jgi:DNA-binding MarR family transcriptional regulator
MKRSFPPTSLPGQRVPWRDSASRSISGNLMVRKCAPGHVRVSSCHCSATIRTGDTIDDVTENSRGPTGASPPGSEDSPALTLYLVKRLELVVRSVLDDALRPLGLTTLQYTALSVLQRRGGLSSAQLARRSFLRPQTMHEMVLTLERRDLIARERDPHNRRVLVANLTGEGRKLLGKCEPVVREVEERMMATFTPGQREIFRESLQEGAATLAEFARRRVTNTDAED